LQKTNPSHQLYRRGRIQAPEVINYVAEDEFKHQKWLILCIYTPR